MEAHTFNLSTGEADPVSNKLFLNISVYDIWYDELLLANTYSYLHIHVNG